MLGRWAEGFLIAKLGEVRMESESGLSSRRKGTLPWAQARKDQFGPEQQATALLASGLCLRTRQDFAKELSQLRSSMLQRSSTSAYPLPQSAACFLEIMDLARFLSNLHAF